jgi:uncharacterized protein YdeI (YjbR/CyaY-like superfamily)
MAEEKWDKRVDAYIAKAGPFARPILNHVRELMHEACPRASEAMKWGMPFFMQQGIVLAHMAAFKQHCAFGFWGPEMKKALEKAGLATDEAMGSLGRLASMKDLPSDKVMTRLMKESAELVESGTRTKSIERKPSPKKGEAKVPQELSAALNKNKLAAKAFQGFSSSARREYAEWIVEAKRPETKAKRVKQAVEWIAEGKKRNWKYENC